jgi:cytochrome c-type biogenesis protein CcmH/NrfF
MFKNTNIKIAFRTSNTVYQQLVQKTNSMNPSGVYKIKCNTCSNNYVGQSGRPIATKHKEHIRYVKTNKPVSAYATHTYQITDTNTELPTTHQN